MDTDKYKFDFIVHGDKIGEMESWFEKFGSHVYHVPPRSHKPIKNILGIASIIKNGYYDVVHCHQDYKGAIAMLLSKHYDVETRIIHSHRSYPPEKAYQKAFRYIQTIIIKRTATHLMACGRQAGEWLYGNKIINNNVIILNNAIQTDKFQFSKTERDKLRKYLNVENSIVVGHIGRFSNQKNHDLLIDIFYNYSKINLDAILILIGDGILRNKIEEKVNTLGIANKILFLGMRDDVHKLLNVMDVFILPSRYEGLGIVAIEAQANGLPVICSKYVPKEVDITHKIYYVEKNEYNNITIWCNLIKKAAQCGRYEKDLCVLIQAGYDINIESSKLESIYNGAL